MKSLEMPKVLEIELTSSCNIACVMCHVTYDKVPKTLFDVKWLNTMSDVKNSLVTVGATYEPMLHPKYLDVLKYFSGNGCQIATTTNGTLLNEKNIYELTQQNIYSICISFDSAKKETYEWIRQKSNFNVVKENITSLGEAFRESDTYLFINMVVMKRNIDEMIEMIDFAESSGVDQINFIFMVLRSVDNDELLGESLWNIREKAYRRLDEAAEYVIQNELKVTLGCPYYCTTKLKSKYNRNIYNNRVFSNNVDARFVKNIRNEAQIAKTWYGKEKCISSHTFARIHSSGDVDLCYKHGIGSLLGEGFTELWRGEKAEAVRNMLLQDKTYCNNCEYYQFCLSSPKIDYEDPKNYFQHNVLSRLKDIDELLKET